MPRPPFFLLLSALFAPAFAEPLSIAQLSAPPSITQVVISPDGKHLATVVRRGRGYGLGIIETENLTAKLILSSSFAREGNWSFFKSVDEVEWAGADLLTVDFGVQAESILLDGTKVFEIGHSVIGPAEPDKKDSALKLVYTDEDDSEVSLVNVRTGERRSFNHPKGKPIKWAFDRRGELRAITVVNSASWKDVSTVTNWYRASASDEWEKLAEFSINDDYWLPIYVPDKPGQLIIRSRQGRDTYAIFEYETRTRSHGAMLAGHPEQDILAVNGVERGTFERVITNGMIPQQVWLEPLWARLQLSIDKELPGRINILSGDPTSKVLIYSYGDVDPGTWYLLNIPDMTMREVARRMQGIDASQMRPKEIISYRAPDGTIIPAYLTRPAAAKGPLATVIYIHGGPVQRDHWEWDPDVQLLANHGYAVLQPQFRGSSGFGRKFEEAGYGQWGLAMQDDVTAGVQHLIREGIADPKRICIYGASYGGYSAMWGLVKTPELYRCGISFAGVSDIGYMWDDWSDRSFNKVVREVMQSRIGDVKTQAGKFADLSPVKNAAKIQAPVLLMHGDEDFRVPISHGKRMRDALEERQKIVEWIEFKGEGHGLRYTHNQERYYQALLAFLEKHLAAPEP